MTDQQFDTQGEAIVAALDEMKEGDTIRVHNEDCTYPKCTCTPRTWTY